MRKSCRWVAVLVGLLMMAACGGAEEPAAEAPEDPAEEASPEGAGDAAVSTEGLVVAYASDIDPNDVADQIGIQAAGATITELTEDSAVVAGMSQGDFEIGNIDAPSAIKAVQAGVPIKIVYVAQDTPEFIAVSQPDITSLDQLEGKIVAYHSPGSLTEILTRELVRQTDPALEDTIDWTVLPESPNRAAAMVAGRIDVTTLEFLDVTTLQEQGDFNILANWGDLEGAAADAVATVWVVTDEYLEGNRETIVAFLRHIQDGYDQFYADEAAWTELVTELLPDVNADILDEAYEYYSSVDMYSRGEEPPITEERWTGLDGFFRQIGEYEQEASIDMVDLEIMAEVVGS